MNPFVPFITWFLRLASKEAADAYKRKKAKEKAANVAKAAAAEKARIDRERLEALAAIAAAKAAYREKMALIDQANQMLAQAKHAAEMAAEAEAHPPGPNPYE